MADFKDAVVKTLENGSFTSNGTLQAVEVLKSQEPATYEGLTDGKKILEALGGDVFCRPHADELHSAFQSTYSGLQRDEALAADKAREDELNAAAAAKAQ